MTIETNLQTEEPDLSSVRKMIQEGRYRPAIRKLRAILKANPKDAAARYLLGVSCFEFGSPADALAAFQQVEAQRPDIPELQTNLGAALAAVGRLSEALRTLQAALEHNPGDLNAQDNLIHTHVELGELDEALSWCEKRLAEAPNDPEGYFLRGNIQMLRGRQQEATADYRQALNLDSEEPRYHYNLGYACFTGGNQKEAVKAFKTFYNLDRKLAALYTFGNSQVLFRRASALAQQNARLRQDRTSDSIIGSSPEMEDLFEILDRVAPEDVTVLIRGESGTGKELFARALHDGSSRKHGPFVALNVAAVPDDLIESELFGHKKGAFTGAVQDQPGLFETASGGSLFLDEIAEMSPRAQTKVLRAIEERKFRRVGDRKEEEIDVRLIVATHQNLLQRVEQGSFRSDLYYRLKVIELFVPALKERPEDIRPLAEHFLDHFAKQHARSIHGIAPGALDRLEHYDWPGNVRELRNAFEHAVIMARGELITEDDLPPEIVPENRPKRRRSSRLENDNESEKTRILKALEETRWHRGRAAEILGVSRRHIYRLMDKYGINETCEKQ